MISFFRRFFFRRKKPTGDNGNLRIPFKELENNNSLKKRDSLVKHPDADVHKLMILATKIKRTDGYSNAIKFLKDIAETYLREGNTALVSCLNKLIPYMRREPSISYKDTRDYLATIIDKIPANEPYFLNLHITMADHINSFDTGESIQYLSGVLNMDDLTHHQYNMLIKLADLNIVNLNEKQARKLLDIARKYIEPCTDRFDKIRRERKWFRTSARLAYNEKNDAGNTDYLYYLFIEFLLDMARVVNPMHIEDFHMRKDLYFKKERGFADSEKFHSSIRRLNIEDKKESILKQLYGFAFEELPLILGVTKTELYFRSGDKESLIEIRAKKVFYRRPFRELSNIQDWVHKFVRSLIPETT